MNLNLFFESWYSTVCIKSQPNGFGIYTIVFHFGLRWRSTRHSYTEQLVDTGRWILVFGLEFYIQSKVAEGGRD